MILMKKFLIITALFIGMLSVASAQDAQALKQRMAARLAAVDELRATQVVGENNAGYLAVLSADATDAKVIVDEENADRKAVYQIIANQTGGSVEAVGKSRARQIREQAKPGTMVQNDDGSWIAKS
ncbi:MAG: hypothetical protein BWY82_01869 [Verrucomicrobia bacterium ADurb.Bin474]|nr:MAG: hypothetical protein BWY82_01869 [Verrucomicrobia bacterium ADurb.Bin474]